MAALQVTLLGTFEAFIENRPLTAFRSDKVRALLIYLVVEADRPHRRETLAGLLWPDFTQTAAQSNLRKSLYHLRKTIDETMPGLSDQLFTITRQTIQISPDYLDVDLFRFQDNLASVKKHRHQHLHNCDECLGRLKQAADTYQADFSHGFSLADASPFESWLLIQREALRQETLIALDYLATSFEIAGDYERARHYAVRQIMIEPWRENAHQQVMRALALGGRRSEALAQYESCRHTLWEELEVEPSAETRQLFEQIKDGTLAPTQTRTRTQLHHFPTQFTPFVGREPQLAEIEARLTDEGCRLLTLIGPGGIGKTRLSVEAAGRLAKKGLFADGIFFVPLVAIEEASYFLMTLAGQLGISIYGRNQLYLDLQNYLVDKEILLVLDNFEQLVAESGLLSDLINGTEKLKFLVTSRESLNVRLEQRLVVGGLADEPAVHLFLQAANRIRPGYKAENGDVESITEVCRLVSGIPLAVEMAAAWVKLLDAAAIAGQIKSNFDILQATYDDVPERHRSMRIVFEESWNLLRPPEQISLAQFSIFQGSFSLYAALDITDTTINEVAALLDKSLLEYPGKSRYQLHELLRQFTRLKLDEIDHRTAREKLEPQFARYYLELVERSEKHLFGKAPQFGVNDIQAEIENVRQAWHLALRNGQLELVSRGLNGLRMYFRISGRFQEAMNHFAAGIEMLAGHGENSEERDRLMCRFYVTAADFAIQIGEFSRATRYLESAQALAERKNWLDTLADVQQTKGDLLYNQGKFIQANATLQRAIAYYERAGDRLNLAESYYKLGICFWRSERWQDTAQILTKAVDLSQELDYNWAVVICLWALGHLYRLNGQRKVSMEYHYRSIQLALDINFMPGVFRGYISVGLNYEDLGDYDKAIESYQLAVEYAQEGGDKLSLSRAYGCLGRAFWKLNRLDEALPLVNLALEITRKLGFKVHLGWQLIVKAEILFALGRYQEAWPVNEEGLKLSRETTLIERILQGQILKARLHSALGQRETALQYLNEMLETAEDVFTIAAVHYELWHLTHEKEHAALAQENYRQAYIKDPYVEYKERIEELKAVLE